MVDLRRRGRTAHGLVGARIFARSFALPRRAPAARPAAVLVLTAVFFVPGGVAGGILGRLVIGPVNRVLGWSFRKFNHYFDRMSSGYAYSVGGLLRVCIVVLLVYAGLLA